MAPFSQILLILYFIFILFLLFIVRNYKILYVLPIALFIHFTSLQLKLFYYSNEDYRCQKENIKGSFVLNINSSKFNFNDTFTIDDISNYLGLRITFYPDNKFIISKNTDLFPDTSGLWAYGNKNTISNLDFGNKNILQFSSSLNQVCIGGGTIDNYRFSNLCFDRVPTRPSMVK